MPYEEKMPFCPISCGQNILDTQDNVSYTGNAENEVLINSITKPAGPVQEVCPQNFYLS
jgi:hypothetical protein